MSTDAQIAPALTPEEWADWHKSWSADPEEGFTRGCAYLTGISQAGGRDGSQSVEVVVDDWHGPGESDYTTACVPPAGRHAIAALALHGQPFGFTREDVEALCDAAQYDESLCSEHGGIAAADQMRHARLRSLADRIAALLPPAGAAGGQEG